MMKRVKIPAPVYLLNLATGKPFRIVDEGAPEAEKKYDPQNRQVGPLKDQMDEFDHARIVHQYLLTDRKFSTSKGGVQYETWRAARRVAKAVDDATDDGKDSYDLRVEDQERLCEVIKSWKVKDHEDGSDRMPNHPWESNMVMMQLMDHFEAILGAEDVKE